MQKKGISLIVLVITIIVMIILAASVVITLSNTGIINKANTAVSMQNMNQIENIVSLAWSDAYMSGVTNKEEIKDRVIQELQNNKVNMNDIAINVTTNGVLVSDTVLKAEPLMVNVLEGFFIEYRVKVPVDYENVYVNFTVESNSTKKVTDYEVDGEYRVYKLGLGSRESWCNVSAEFCASHDGEVVKLKADAISVETYCKSILAKGDAEVDSSATKGKALKKVAAAMLNYAAKTQISLNSNPENLVDDGVEFNDEFVELTYDDRERIIHKETTTKHNAFNVSHDSCVEIIERIYSTNPQAITVKIKSENSSEVIREYKDFFNGGTNYYIIYAKPIRPINYKDLHTFEIYENGELIETIKFSIRSFVYSHQNKTESDGVTLTALANTVRAMWQYYQAVEAYYAI